MDLSSWFKELGKPQTILLAVLAWVALEVYGAVSRHDDQILGLTTDMRTKADLADVNARDNDLRDRVSTLEGRVDSISSLQNAFMKTLIGRSPTPGSGIPSIDGPGIDHAE